MTSTCGSSAIAPSRRGDRRRHGAAAIGARRRDRCSRTIRPARGRSRGRAPGPRRCARRHAPHRPRPAARRQSATTARARRRAPGGRSPDRGRRTSCRPARSTPPPAASPHGTAGPSERTRLRRAVFERGIDGEAIERVGRQTRRCRGGAASPPPAQIRSGSGVCGSIAKKRHWTSRAACSASRMIHATTRQPERVGDEDRPHAHRADESGDDRTDGQADEIRRRQDIRTRLRGRPPAPTRLALV